MKFRPCIDLHGGAVKQIVGSTLSDDDPEGLKTNFTTDKPSSWFAELYRQDNLTGGHIIKLGPGNDGAARQALAAGIGTSTFPVARAFQRLRREGLLVARSGMGTFVAPRLAERRRVMHLMLRFPLPDSLVECGRNLIRIEQSVYRTPCRDRARGSSPATRSLSRG